MRRRNDLPRASGQDRTDDRLARVIGAQPGLFAIPLASASAEQRRTGGEAAKTRIESVPKLNLSPTREGCAPLSRGTLLFSAPSAAPAAGPLWKAVGSGQ
jgi:hypothetical protein